jgi:hypothetical protein
LRVDAGRIAGQAVADLGQRLAVGLANVEDRDGLEPGEDAGWLGV